MAIIISGETGAGLKAVGVAGLLVTVVVGIRLLYGFVKDELSDDAAGQ